LSFLSSESFGLLQSFCSRSCLHSFPFFFFLSLTLIRSQSIPSFYSLFTTQKAILRLFRRVLVNNDAIIFGDKEKRNIFYPSLSSLAANAFHFLRLIPCAFRDAVIRTQLAGQIKKTLNGQWKGEGIPMALSPSLSLSLSLF